MTESRDDDGFVTRTAREWHDEACWRDSGHDEMQLAVMRWLGRHDRSGSKTPVVAEFPIVSRERGVVAFADLACIEDISTDSAPCKRLARLFVVAPRIHSVGAIMRQCRILQFAAERYMHDKTGLAAEVRVCAVVPMSDPKLDVLRAMFGNTSVIRWDMDEGRPA